MLHCVILGFVFNIICLSKYCMILHRETVKLLLLPFMHSHKFVLISVDDNDAAQDIEPCFFDLHNGLTSHKIPYKFYMQHYSDQNFPTDEEDAV